MIQYHIYYTYVAVNYITNMYVYIYTRILYILYTIHNIQESMIFFAYQGANWPSQLQNRCRTPKNLIQFFAALGSGQRTYVISFTKKLLKKHQKKGFEVDFFHGFPAMSPRNLQNFGSFKDGINMYKPSPKMVGLCHWLYGWELATFLNHENPTKIHLQMTGWWYTYHPEKYEFVNGKDYPQTNIMENK